VLFKYGFQDFVEGLRIEEYLEVGLQLISRKRRERIEQFSRAERVRLALEELGPTFIKLGQILSTRPDLVPLQYIQELSKLQDGVPPFPYDKAIEIVRDETGKMPEDFFQHFEKTAIAAGSIGQVHKALLRNGEEVVVKVQRPGIQSIIQIDLEIMLHLASLMERHLEEMRIHQPTKIVEEFAHTLEKEVDFTNEAAYIERFARLFISDDEVYVPKIFHELSTERILTMEYIDGIKASEIDRLQRDGYDLKKLARNGASLILKQIFVHGFFHADPHPGNVFILPNNIVCYLDFGMMGHLSSQDQLDFTELILAIIHHDGKKAGNALLKLTYFQKEPDKKKLERDLDEFMHRHIYKPLKQWEVGKLLNQLLEMARRFGLQIKPEFFLLIKALSTAESVGRMMDPDFDIIKHAEPFVRLIQSRRLSPIRIANDMMESGTELLSLLRDTPRELHEILRQAKAGKVKIEFEHRGLEPVLFSNNRISNRISFSIVLASLIVASSLIVLSGVPPKWHEIPIIGLTGFIIAGIMGFWLLISMLRHGKM
jgi:ubiquinone biosynthesis protein